MQVGDLRETNQRQKLEAATAAALLQQTRANHKAAALREVTAAWDAETLRKALDKALSKQNNTDARHVAATAQAVRTLRCALAERDAAVEQARVLGQSLTQSEGKLAGAVSQLQLHASSTPFSAQVGCRAIPLLCWTHAEITRISPFSICWKQSPV